MKKKTNKKEITPELLRERISEFFEQYSTTTYSIKQLYKKFGLREDKDRILFSSVIQKMVETGAVSKLKNDTFRYGSEAKFVTGRVDYVNPRFGYVCSEGLDEDIWVSSSKMG